MMLRDRDKEAINYIEKFKIATTDTLAELFYPNLTIAQRRLRLIAENRYLKRDRDHFTHQYYYYIQKPKQLRHSLLLTDFYRELNKIAEIQLFEPEYECENVRADGLVTFIYNNKGYIAFIEVEISNNGLDLEKYEKLYKSGKYKHYYPMNILGAFPYIVVISDKGIPKTNLQVINISEDIKNLKEALV